MPLGLLIIVALLVAMWFLLVRPARRRQAQQQNVLSRVEIGDEIVTAGGIYGHVEAIEDDEVHLEIAPGTVVRVARRAVAAIVPSEDEEAEADAVEDAEPEALEEGEPAALEEGEPQAVADGEPEAVEPASEEAPSGSARR